MTTRTITIDDLDGKTEEGVKPVTFMISGAYFTIDLGPDNYKQFQAELAKYVAVAAPITRTRSQQIAGEIAPGAAANKPGGGNTTDSVEADTVVIRAWAIANPHLLPSNVKVMERGALPKAAVEAYNQHVVNAKAEESK